MQGQFWLRVAGIVTWLVCGIPLLRLVSAGRLDAGSAAAAAVLFAAFGAAFWLNTRPCQGRPGRSAFVLVALQTIAAFVLIAASGDTLPAALLVVVAGQLPFLLPARGASVWVAAQSAVMLVVFWPLEGPVLALAAGGAFVGFQVFALSTAWLAHSERSAREALARANAELHATRALLEENTRVAERLRIARDLHDTLGHHLTALSLQLDVAARLASGDAAHRVREAHAITRLLLSDVRDVVSRMRDSSRIDLASAVRTLAAGAADISVHVEMPDRLDVDDPAQAHALLRCVQEIITNASRHAAARNLWIALEPGAEGLSLHARDDGRGVPAIEWGNGLRGMRERFEEYAGRVEFRSGTGQGFEIRGFMPRPHNAA